MSLIPIIFLYIYRHKYPVKCHNFRNPVITAGECSLGRFHTVPTGNTDVHTDAVFIDVQMCFGHDWVQLAHVIIMRVMHIQNAKWLPEKFNFSSLSSQIWLEYVIYVSNIVF